MVSLGPIESVLIVLIVALPLLASALFQWLWNLTMLDVFGLKRIRYWQAFRLIVMAVILFGLPRIGT